MDIIFGVDILVNFISATEDTTNNTLIYDHKKLAKNYIKSWFILDLIACFPFGIFSKFLSEDSSSGNFSNKELLRLARLPRLYRLVRLLRMFKMVRLLKNNEAFSTFFEMLSADVIVMIQSQSETYQKQQNKM